MGYAASCIPPIVSLGRSVKTGFWGAVLWPQRAGGCQGYIVEHPCGMGPASWKVWLCGCNLFSVLSVFVNSVVGYIIGTSVQYLVERDIPFSHLEKHLNSIIKMASVQTLQSREGLDILVLDGKTTNQLRKHGPK